MELSLHEERVNPVSRSDSESVLAALERGARDRNAGFFGPRSMTWKIHREAALFLGAGRAALLQLAHPWVATAIEQHSTVMSRPIARFHNTFRIVYTMIFGTVDQALAASRHLCRVHIRVRGEMTEDVAAYRRGEHYEANEIGALRWVYATLIETAVLAFDCVMPPLTPHELEDYYEETKLLAALFGLPATALPSDWPAFLAYCRAMEQSSALGVNDNARKMGHNVLAGAGSWIKPPHWYGALTAEWLPARFRSEFSLPFEPEDKQGLERARQWLPNVYLKFPAALRFVGPWHEATARLRGRATGPVSRLSNRFWIGQPRLPFARQS
jgi:uncharacterized protein (DUF2236 family)